jgi:hypothetical protein
MLPVAFGVFCSYPFSEWFWNLVFVECAEVVDVAKCG